MTDLTERLRKRAEEDAKCAENSKVVADLLRPQLEAFEANEDKGNVYAIRMAVDHSNSVKRDGQYAADLLEAATTLETLTQENARLRGSRDGILEALDEALKQYCEPMSMLNSHELGERLASDVAEIVRHAPARKALGGGDE